MARSAALWAYGTRITPALSCGVLGLLAVFSFVVRPFGVEEEGSRYRDATFWQLVLCAHILFLHIVSTLFPLRALFALSNVIGNIKKAKETSLTIRHSGLHNAVRFAILIPAYQEDEETLRRTLSVLASHSRAQSMYHIYLAFEEREKDAATKANNLITTFRDCFFDMSFTLHPYGLPGEVPGKSSNESWAAKQVFQDYYGNRLEDVIVTTMDSDTHLPASYFTQILELHSNASIETRENTIYMPPLVFDRNLHKVPLLVRTADVLWACAGISSMYYGSRVAIPTSVYSLPLSLVEQVGGWDTDASAIGEDMHMYLKCLFASNGNLTARVVYAAASQCSVGSGSPGIRGNLGDILARYQQAIRHMWGALDTGYAVRQTCGMIMRPCLARDVSESLVKCDDDCYQNIGRNSKTTSMNTPQQRIHWRNILTVFMRLFEAHQLPLQLAVGLITSDVYRLSYPSFLIPSALSSTLSFCKICRTISFLLMLAVFYRYEQYHRLCAGLRKEEMRACGLWDEAGEEEEFTPNVFQRFGILEAVPFPIAGLLFGIIPALQAILTHVFTQSLVYKVSLKPQLLRRKLDLKVSMTASEYSDMVWGEKEKVEVV